VPETVAEMDERFDLLVSLDAHIDDHFGVGESIEAFPDRIKLAALRASAHAELRYCMGKYPPLRGPNDFAPDMVLVLSRTSLITHVATIENMLEESGAANDSLEESLPLSYERFLKDVLGIEMYLFPPRDLMKLSKRTEITDFWLLDVDVDYMNDMQGECYTPMKKAGPGDLGWSGQVLRFIRKCKPDVITISEAKVEAIRNQNSAFSRFTARLSSNGYKLEESDIFESDKEAEDRLSLYQEFYEKVQKGLVMKNLAQRYRRKSYGGDDNYRAELAKVTREFFATKSS